MRRIASVSLVVLLILLLVACNYPMEQNEAPSSQESGEEEAEIDYCDLPRGTRVTWFDLSTFIFIPESGFMMGHDEVEDDFDYEPAHQVSLGAFWMHETEVTNRQYANCVQAGQCEPPTEFPEVPYWYEQTEKLDDPVVGVSWEQADNYCEWIGTRLPTEAEWELAARGEKSFDYPWGVDAPDCEHANYKGCLDPEDSQPIIAGSLLKGISPFEMLDMTGNVNEWVSDWYAADYYQNSPAVNPTGPESGEQRVWRGGGYLSPAEELYTYLRNALKPDESQPDLGFRCAWSCGENVPPQLCQLPPTLDGGTGKPPNPQHPNVTGEGYCEWRRGGKSAGVVLNVPDGMYLNQYDVSSPNGDVSCDQIEEGLWVCYGPAVKPDSNVTLTICPDCQPGYYFDYSQGLCVPIQAGDLEPQQLAGFCDSGYMYTEGCGCIPIGHVCLNKIPEKIESGDITSAYETLQAAALEEAMAGDDPEPEDEIDPIFFLPFELMPQGPLDPGHIELDPNWNPPPDDCGQGNLVARCAPNTFSMIVDGCRRCVPLLTQTECPEGYTFDPAANCCVPETTVRYCPRFTYYDPVSNSCIPITFEDSCFDLTVYVPDCPPQERPTPETQERPTPEPSCKNPDQYTTQSTCEAALCKWVFSVAGKPFCTTP